MPIHAPSWSQPDMDGDLSRRGERDLAATRFGGVEPSRGLCAGPVAGGDRQPALELGSGAVCSAQLLADVLEFGGEPLDRLGQVGKLVLVCVEFGFGGGAIGAWPCP